MAIIIGADHRGYELKNHIVNFMHESGYEIIDMGPSELVPRDDFVDYAEKVSRMVAQDLSNKGIVICGSGAGVSIASNKIKGVRCSIGFNIEQVKASRRDDNINVLAIASDFTLFEDAKIMIQTFLQTPYEPTDNHVRRIEKIKNLENNSTL